MSVVTPVTLQKPLTSMTTSRKPLSQMIKDDQLKNDIKLQKKAIIARKEQQEKQYKQYIIARNRDFAQQYMLKMQYKTQLPTSRVQDSTAKGSQNSSIMNFLDNDFSRNRKHATDNQKQNLSSIYNQKVFIPGIINQSFKHESAVTFDSDSKFIDLERTNKISLGQSQWIKKNTFKVQFENTIQGDRVAHQEVGGVNLKGKVSKVEKTQSPNHKVVHTEESVLESKIMSDPTIHGFYEFRSRKFLQRYGPSANVRSSVSDATSSAYLQSNYQQTQLAETLEMEGIKPNQYLLMHRIQPKIYKTMTLEERTIQQKMSVNVASLNSSKEYMEPAISIRGSNEVKIEQQVFGSTLEPAATCRKTPRKKHVYTQYEILLSKFSEFMESGEFKRAQQANNQARKIWPSRLPYFTMNFALQCLVQGNPKRAVQIIEQIICDEYQRPLYKDLLGVDLVKELDQNVIIKSAIYNLMYCKALQLTTTEHNLESSRFLKSEEMNPQEIAENLTELFEMLEFHGYSRLKFTIETEEIKFQKLVVLLKNILKEQKCNSFKRKSSIEELDETINPELQKLAFFQRVTKNYVEIDFKYGEDSNQLSTNSNQERCRNKIREQREKVEVINSDNIFSKESSVISSIKRYQNKQIYLDAKAPINYDNFRVKNYGVANKNNTTTAMQEKVSVNSFLNMRNISSYKDKYEIESESFNHHHRHESPMRQDSPLKDIFQEDQGPLTVDFKMLKADYIQSPEPEENINGLTQEIIPFPYRNPILNIKDYKKQIQLDKKKELGFGHLKLDQSMEIYEEEQQSEILNLATVDKCLINMEELEMEVNRVLLETKNEYEPPQKCDMTDFFPIEKKEIDSKLADPVNDMYMLLLYSIKNLCLEDGILQILLDAKKEKRGKPDVTSTFEKERANQNKKFYADSSAKNILIRAVLRNKRIYSENIEQDFQIKIDHILDKIQEEMTNPVKKEAISYIDLAGQEIEKMLSNARIKKKERKMINSKKEEKTVGSQQLSQVFEDLGNKKVLFKRLGMYDEQFLKNLMQNDDAEISEDEEITKVNYEEIQKKKAIESQLVTFQTANDSKIELYMTQTSEFLTYFFENFSSLFLFQRNYCLTDFFETCPDKFITYLGEIQQIISTIPLRFSVLTSDNIDDQEYQLLEQQEFIYNRDDPTHRLISQGLRYQQTIDALGLQKSKWLEEIYKKFNILTLLNYVFRECLDFNFSDKQENIPSAIYHGALFSPQILKKIIKQYALKKCGIFNPEIVNLAFQHSNFPIKIFQNLNSTVRNQIFNSATYKFLNSGNYDLGTQNFIFSKEEILFILSGTIEIYLLKKEPVLFQQLPNGVSLPIIQIFKLSALQGCPVRLVLNTDVNCLLFNQKTIANEVFSPLKTSLITKMQALCDLTVFFGNDESQGQKAGDQTSPYLIFVMAICCQVKVNKYSESVVQKGEIPKALHVIIDGKGQIIYEDRVLREVLPSEYCRNKMRPPEPQNFVHGNKTIDQVCRDNIIATKRQNSMATAAPRPKKVEEIKKNYIKQHIEFKQVKKGSFFASRVLIDEPIIKNYIKQNKANIMKWIREPVQKKIQSIIKKFTLQQCLLSCQDKNLDIKNKMVNLNQRIELKSEDNIREQYNFDKVDTETVAAAFHLETLSENEAKVMRAFLLSSQLSVVVKSHELKCMMIRRQDKVYFGESIKKIFDERMQMYEFKDIDRPMQEAVQIEKIRLNNRKWDLFKRQFEEQVLKQGYYERLKLKV